MFKSILNEYRIEYIGKGNMPGTADQVIEKLAMILSRLNQQSGVHMEGERIAGINVPVLKRWYNLMTADNLKMATRNNYVTLLNPFLFWACDMRRIVKDPQDERPVYEVLKVNRLPREDETPEHERKQKMLTPDQVHALILESPGRYQTRDRAILALFLASGLRVSELCSLTLASILESDPGTVYVRRKGGSWKHTEVADFCYKYLRDYLDTRDLSDLSAPLFITAQGTPCSRKQLWKLIADKEKHLGLPTGVHILRHTTLSNAEKHGGAGVARDIANHSTLFMTNKYDHTTHEDRRAALNMLDWSDL